MREGLVLVHMDDQFYSVTGLENDVRYRIDQHLFQGNCVYDLQWRSEGHSKLVEPYGDLITRIPLRKDLRAQFFDAKLHIYEDGVEKVDLCGQAKIACVTWMTNILSAEYVLAYSKGAQSIGLDRKRFKEIGYTKIPVRHLEDLIR